MLRQSAHHISVNHRLFPSGILDHEKISTLVKSTRRSTIFYRSWCSRGGVVERCGGHLKKLCEVKFTRHPDEHITKEQLEKPNNEKLTITTRLQGKKLEKRSVLNARRLRQ